MKIYFYSLALIVVFPFFGWTQKHFHNELHVLPLQANNQTVEFESIYNNNQLFTSEQAIYELAIQLGFPAEYGWQLDTLVESLSGKHYLFQATFNNIPIHSFTLKVNVNTTSNKIQSVYANGNKKTPVTVIQNEVDLEQVMSHLPKIHIHPKAVKSKTVYWFNSNKKQLELGWQLDVLDVYEMHTELVFVDSEIPVNVHVKNRFSHFNDTDTLLTGKVFMPDPLTRAGVTYGGVYVDSADADLPNLNHERVQRSAWGTYENQRFVLKNNYIQISDHSFPTVPPSNLVNDTFDFTRTYPEFEDFNAYYHINNYQDYIQLLGFTNLVNYPIRVDVHALGGQDQSSFGEFLNPPTLSFGEGGVDDAEDADVIIHEYGHAISYSAAPNTNIGTQRQTLDEALGDYIAVSYSRDIMQFNWNWVFNWDGHNEFWDGRIAYTNDEYPADLLNDIYADADIWSTALIDIENAIGRYATHRILFESLYSYAANITMVDAAVLMVQADSTVFNGAYHGELCIAFAARGILKPNCVVSVPNFIRVDHNDVAAIIQNNLEVYIDTYNQLKVFNQLGQEVVATTLNSSTVNLNSILKHDGIYFIQLTTPLGDSVQFKYLHQHAN